MRINTPFFHSVGSEPVHQRTELTLKKTETGLHFTFQCFNNPYLEFNKFTKDNDPLWQQETLEVFIAPSNHDATRYIEFQINPNNAIFLAQVTNPNLLGNQNTLEMLNPELFAINHQVIKDVENESWSGTFLLPFTLLGDDTSSYRTNIFRIIRTTPIDTFEWQCNSHNSTFACWQPTNAIEKPSFHRPQSFALINF